MKKVLLLLLVMMCTMNIAAQENPIQITTTEIAETKKEATKPYDSLKNFLGKNVYEYIGQELYLKGKHEKLREYGYADFHIDYEKSTSPTNASNVYKCCNKYYSKYTSLEGKYFNVIAVHEDSEGEIYLELKEKESEDIIYFKYRTTYENSFPFIVVGFFKKRKDSLINQEFVFKNNILKGSTDNETGNVVKTVPNQIWKCTDLTIEQKNYKLALVIKNAFGETTTISYNSVFGEYSKGRVYTKKEANNNKQRFGKTDWLTILSSKVKVGFTKEMVLLSWGKPDKVNTSSYRDQWVYGSQYLYFKDGEMKSFN